MKELAQDQLKLLEKLKKYCVFQERCSEDIKQKLWDFGVRDSKSQNKLIAFLQNEKFIDDQRFAEMFVRGKFNKNHWGRIKISFELHNRKINPNIISVALKKIEEYKYIQTLELIILKKINQSKEQEAFALKNKVANYAISKGFESELVWKILNRK